MIPDSCDPFSEVLDRIRCFMEQQNLSDLQWETVGKEKISYFSRRSDDLTSVIRNIPNQADQPEWVLDISLSCSIKEENPKEYHIMARLSCFSHSPRGVEIVERLTRTMPGEICRTNRRWRRRIDRHVRLQENDRLETL